MSVTKNYLSVIHHMADTVRDLKRPDERTHSFFEATFDELMWQVYKLKPHLAPAEQVALEKLWQEYASLQSADLTPSAHPPNDYPEDRLAALLERFRKVVE